MRRYCCTHFSSPSLSSALLLYSSANRADGHGSGVPCFELCIYWQLVSSSFSPGSGLSAHSPHSKCRYALEPVTPNTQVLSYRTGWKRFCIIKRHRGCLQSVTQRLGLWSQAVGFGCHRDRSPSKQLTVTHDVPPRPFTDRTSHRRITGHNVSLQRIDAPPSNNTIAISPDPAGLQGQASSS